MEVLVPEVFHSRKGVFVDHTEAFTVRTVVPGLHSGGKPDKLCGLRVNDLPRFSCDVEIEKDAP